VDNDKSGKQCNVDETVRTKEKRKEKKEESEREERQQITE
jgi:hypothetical protein